MRNKTKKFISAFLTLAMMLGLLWAMPIPVRAANKNVTIGVNDSAKTIEDNINNALKTLGPGDTVTVTGGSSNPKSSHLNLNLSSGATVVWKAQLWGDTGSMLIRLYTSGKKATFEVANGADILNHNGKHAIFSVSENIEVKVTGGIVQADGTGFAIDVAEGNSVTVSGGEVSSWGGEAIKVFYADTTVTVTGGIVHSESREAIRVTGANASINVTGGRLSSENWDAIGVFANNATVTVSSNNSEIYSHGANQSAIYSNGANNTITVGGGSVYSDKPTGYAICTDGTAAKIKVSGGARVENKGPSTGGAAILIRSANSTVEVSGSGRVQSDYSEAIRVQGGNCSVKLSDGRVYSENWDSIGVFANNATIEVGGGTFGHVSSSAANHSAIYANGDNNTIKVSGGGMVTSDKPTGYAICTDGTAATIKVSGGWVYKSWGVQGGSAILIRSANSTVEVSGSGMVRSYTESAIYATGANSTIKVSGGAVFGINPCIKMNSGLTPTITGNAVVCAWDKPSGTPTYTEGSSTNLILNSGATAKWSNDGGQPGIFYKNGTNEGYFPLNGVPLTVMEASQFGTNGPTLEPGGIINPGDIQSGLDIAPKITGPTEMTLVEGYAAISTGVYTITSSPEPMVAKADGGEEAITWNSNTKTLDIAAGLSAGTYKAVIRAISGTNTSSLTFTLTVTAAPTTEPATEPATEPPTETATSPTEKPTEPTNPPPPPPPFPFVDMLSTDWFYNNVKTAWEMGLVNGKTPTTYEPTANLTYAEAVKLAACMHQYYQEGNVTLVIGTTNWYDTYVEYAMTNGIISKDYEWNAFATRAGYMEIFANALPDAALGSQNSVANGSIPDVPMSHPQAAAIYKLYRAGIVQGVDNVTHACNPGSNIQRSEVAAIIDRMMNPSSRVTFTLG